VALKDLFFNIIARDRTGAAFDAVKDRLRETDRVAASLNDRVRRTGERMRDAGLAASAASAGLFAAFRGSVDLADQQARAEAKVAQAIRATGAAAGFTAEELFRQASALQGLTRFGDEAILDDVTAQFLTFKNLTGDVFLDAQRAALDLATTLDADLQGTAIMLGKALNDPAVGLSALGEAGVTFTEVQKEVIKRMAETGDIAGAQRMILEEIASAYGGQAEAARQAGAGTLDAWRNTWGDIKEVVGKVILELLPPVIGFLEKVAAGFQAMPEPAQRFVVVAGLLAAALPPVIASLGLLTIGLAGISAPVLAVVAGIAAATAAVVAFWPEIKAAAGYVKGLWEELSAFEVAIAPAAMAVRALWDAFEATFPRAAELVSATVEAIVGWLRDKLGDALGAVSRRVEAVGESFAWLYDKVVGNSWVPDMVDEIGEHFARLDGNMVDKTAEATGAVSDAFQGLASGVGSKLKTLASEGELTFKGFMGALRATALEGADRIVSEAWDKLGAGLSDALGGALSGGAGAQAGGGAGGGLLGGLASGLIGGARGLLGFNDCGAFTVRGRAGVDRNVASVRLSEGEEVQVTRRGDGGCAV
jgi:hypothetical protein